MAVPKRTRFEVLRRDGYACRYCGRRAPAVELVVDHVVPTALGGTDDPSNLTAACADCNSGKAASGPDEQTVADVDGDALRWAAALRLAAEREAAEHRAQEDRLDGFLALWESSVPSYARNRPHLRLPGDWKDTCLRLLDAGLTDDQLLRAAQVALSARADNAFRYLVGVANRMLADLHARARQAIEDGDV